MQNIKFEESVKKITKLIFTSPQKLIREEDLRNLSLGFDFEEIISEVYTNLKKIGFEFIKSKFQDQNYYVLTSEGKDDDISPSQYGTLALIFTLAKEVDEDLNIDDLKEVFKEVWTSDIISLIEKDYIRKIDNLNILKITPLGKAVLKNVLQDLNLKDLLELFEVKK
jgi:hypothetical protein